MEDCNPTVELNSKVVGNTGKVILTATLNDRPIYTDKIDISTGEERKKYIKGLLEKAPFIPVQGVENKLEEIAASILGIKDEKKSQADLLVELVGEDVELFYSPNKEPYASFPSNDHIETYRINTKGFKLWLGGRFYNLYTKAPGNQAVTDALGIIASKALYEGSLYPIFVRVGKKEETHFLDLADERWRVVELTKDGWQILDNSPVKFVHPSGLKPIAEPVHNGSIQILRQFMDPISEEDWVLILAWLVAALQPKGPYPVLSVSGEQGSGKSTRSKMLRTLLDPNVSPLRTPPRSEQDLIIAANNSHCIALDNISSISTWLSDALCRLSTGGGFSTRALYSNDEEVIFDAQRPVILNGIGDLATRSDLLDRSLTVTFSSIPEEKRQEERLIWQEFKMAIPVILGGLLDAHSMALNRLPEIQLNRLPRMADFARLIVAAEPILAFPTGTFMDVYSGNRAAAHEIAIDQAAIGPVICEFVAKEESWSGTPSELLEKLDNLVEDKITRRRDWPKSAGGLSKILNRLAPNFRQIGIEVAFRRSGGTRKWHLDRIRNLPAQTAQLSHSAELPENKQITDALVVEGNFDSTTEIITRDGCDGCDGFLPTQAKSAREELEI